jgi:hypothetical protein
MAVGYYRLPVKKILQCNLGIIVVVPGAYLHLQVLGVSCCSSDLQNMLPYYDYILLVIIAPVLFLRKK